MGTVSSQKGMSLLELLFVIAVSGLLFALGTLSFKSMQDNSRIDGQAKELYADLMKARSEALFRKTSRSVRLISSTELAVYASNNGSGAPVLQKNFPQKYPVASNDNNLLVFDASGVADRTKAYCVGPAGNKAGVDSVVISTTSIMMGKLSGEACTSANIVAK